MFGSFQNIPPSGAHSVWYSSTYFADTSQEPVVVASASNPTAALDRAKRADRGYGGNNGRPSALQLLQMDEIEVRKRKLNVARFGAAWIRPPGVPKTLQAMMDEAAERAEQEAVALREAAAAEQQAAFEAQQQQEEEEARRQRPWIQRMNQEVDLFSGPPELEDDMVEERDLDDDVPDADDAGFGLSDEDEMGEVDLDATDEDTGGNFMEASHILPGFVYSHVTNRYQDEHDLDDDVPEAGSYQHTDTDVEDDSSDAGLSSPAGRPLSLPQSQTTSPAEGGGQGMTVVQDFSQRSLARLPMPSFSAAGAANMSSPGAAESSMLVSSPSVPRGRVVGGGGVARGSAAGAGGRRNVRAAPPPDWTLRQPDFGS